MRTHYVISSFSSVVTEIVTASVYLQKGLEGFGKEIRLLPNGIDLSVYQFRNRSQIAPKVVWVRALKGLYATGMQPQTSAYRFCTNAAYSAGVAGVPTIGFGPATEADAHVIDERLPTDALIAATRGYQSIIKAVLA